MLICLCFWANHWTLTQLGSGFIDYTTNATIVVWISSLVDHAAPAATMENRLRSQSPFPMLFQTLPKTSFLYTASPLPPFSQSIYPFDCFHDASSHCRWGQWKGSILNGPWPTRRRLRDIWSVHFVVLFNALTKSRFFVNFTVLSGKTAHNTMNEQSWRFWTGLNDQRSDLDLATMVELLSKLSLENVLLRELNGCLRCNLCEGYYVQPVVLQECQHTFCYTVSSPPLSLTNLF